MTLSATIDRTSLGLPALVLSNDPSGTYVIPEDGLTEPEFDERTTFADDSGHTSGSLPTQSVTGVGTWQCIVTVHGTDDATLKANKRALEAAVRQRLTFSATLDIVGSPDTYTCLPGKVSWGTVDSGMTRAFMARAAVTVPCLPLVGA